MKKLMQRSLHGMVLSLSLLSVAACGGIEEVEPAIDAVVEESGESVVAEAPAESGAEEADESASDVEPAPAGQGCAAFDTDERFLPVADLVAAMDDPDCAAGQSITFVDARPQFDYEFGHIPGAVNAPYFNIAGYVDDLPRDRWLILYCECPHAEAVQAADALTSEENGFTMVKVIDEGLGGWRDLGRDIVTDES